MYQADSKKIKSEEEPVGSSFRAAGNSTLQALADSSPQVKKGAQLQSMANAYTGAFRSLSPPIDKKSAPVQRLRIRLGNDDPELFAALAQVPVPNDGGRRGDDLGALNTTAPPLAINENIAFEGHGETTRNGETVSQGGCTPDQLAAYAHRVPKVAGWTGEIFLLGCKTGPLTEGVSKAYYTLTGDSPVKVNGTKAPIRVGLNAGGRFIGSDQNVPDLAFINELLLAVQLYGTTLSAINSLFSEILSLGQTATGGTTTGNLDTIRDAWAPFTGIDTSSTNTKSPGRDYKLPERQAIDMHFTNLITALDDVDIFIPPNRVLRIGTSADRIAEIAAQTAAASTALTTFRSDIVAVENINQFINGLRLTPIDLANAGHMTSAKKKRKTIFRIGYWGDAD